MLQRSACLISNLTIFSSDPTDVHSVDDGSVDPPVWAVDAGEAEACVLSVRALFEEDIKTRAVGEFREGDGDLDREVFLVWESRGRNAEIVITTNGQCAVRGARGAVVEFCGDAVLCEIPERHLC